MSEYLERLLCHYCNVKIGEVWRSDTGALYKIPYTNYKTINRTVVITGFGERQIGFYDVCNHCKQLREY